MAKDNFFKRSSSYKFLFFIILLLVLVNVLVHAGTEEKIHVSVNVVSSTSSSPSDEKSVRENFMMLSVIGIRGFSNLPLSGLIELIIF